MKLPLILLATALVAGLTDAQRYTQYARHNGSVADVSGIVSPSEDAGVVRTIHTSKDGRTRLELRKTYENKTDEKPKFSGFRFSHRF